MGKLVQRTRKVDGNHKTIVQAFRRLGYAVLSLAAIGKGCPDLLCSKAGFCFLAEVKDGTLSPSQRKFTPDQETFWKTWLGPIVLITSVEDVIAYDRKRHTRIQNGTL